MKNVNGTKQAAHRHIASSMNPTDKSSASFTGNPAKCAHVFLL